MELPPPPPNPPAIVISVEHDAELAEMVQNQQKFAELLGPARESFRPELLAEKEPQATHFVSRPTKAPADTLVSNRPEGQKTSVVYINGIQTSRSDARKATLLVRSSIGVEREDVSLLYNPPESNRAMSFLKVGAGIISSRLSNQNEPECSSALKARVKSAIRNPDERLIIVTHSHGSQIATSVLDTVYDDFQKTARGRRQWRENAGNIEVLMYAPLVRSLPAGVQGVGLSNKLDLPARGAGRVARGMSALKDVTGWRDHDLIRHIKYSPEENRMPDLVFNPESVHCSFNLIFDNVYFNIQLLGQNPSTGRVSPTLLANNLAKSIREGRRSDNLHLETIVQSCDAYGDKFSRAFLRHVKVDPETGAGAMNDFVIVPGRMARLTR